MPKRSNQFQKIVTYIAEQLAPLGATVRESVELPEKGLSGVRREIDTLIEVEAGLTRVRVAVESRNRKRKDDIQWIDDLIGKYANLPVDRVLAVSSAGFSSSAKQKAALHNIEILSPQEIVDTDWSSKFQKLGFALLKIYFNLEHVEFETNPPFSGAISLKDRIRLGNETGENFESSVREFIEEVGPSVIVQIRRHIGENFLTLYKNLEDLKKAAIIDRSVSGNGFSLLAGTSCFQIHKITFRVIVRIDHTIAPVQHQVLGDNALLSSARVGKVDTVIAQVAGESQGKVFLRQVASRKSRRKQQMR